jgi:hypothetical protein
VYLAESGMNRTQKNSSVRGGLGWRGWHQACIQVQVPNYYIGGNKQTKRKKA